MLGLELKDFIEPEIIFEHVLQLFYGILIFFVLWLVAIIVNKLILKVSRKLSHDKKVIFQLLANIAKNGIIVLAVITALGSIGFNVNALVAGLGLTGFAMSFAVKDSLSNILSGILIILYQPFKVGQYIKISGNSGKVKTIDLRYTVLIHEDKKVLIPNTMIFTKEVTVSDVEF